MSIELIDKQPLVTNTYISVGKGTKNKALVMKFLNEMLSPEMQAAFVNNNMGNGPITNNSMHLIKPEAQKLIPDLKADNVAIADAEWWADHYDKIAPRFKEWLLNT